MQKIIDYTIINGDDKLAVISDTKFFINQGWQPFGSLTLQIGEKIILYCQPMVMYAEDN